MTNKNSIPRRFNSTARLYGLSSYEIFKKSHLVVIGIGGVGSWAAEALARSGIGKLTLIDLDHIAESNINRQIHALDSSIGQAKITAMAQRIKLINPDCQVIEIDDFLDVDNCRQLISTDCSGIIDACDQINAKLAIIKLAKQHEIPFITVGAAGGKKSAHLVEIADITKASHDPILAKIRYKIRKTQMIKQTKSLQVPCVFSREEIIKPATDCDLEQSKTASNLNCHGYGSGVAITATFGMCAAGWLLNQLGSNTK